MVVKSVLFALFEKRLPHLRAALRMFLSKLCGVARRGDDRKRRNLAYWSATGLGPMLVTIKKAVQSGSSPMARTKVAREPGWDHDYRAGGELHLVHGRARCP